MEMTTLTMDNAKLSTSDWRIPKEIYRNIDSEIHFIAGEGEINQDLKNFVWL
jgi:hypothetical protein